MGRQCRVNWTIVPTRDYCCRMSKISWARHRYPTAIIQRAVLLYFRFPLSFRDVGEMLVECGGDVCNLTIRRWILMFGPAIACKERSRRVQQSEIWHLDEAFVRIGDKRTYLWRAVEDEGEVLEVLAQSRRDGCNDFGRSTMPSTTISNCNTIWSPAELFVKPAPRQSVNGSKFWLIDLGLCRHISFIRVNAARPCTWSDCRSPVYHAAPSKNHSRIFPRLTSCESSEILTETGNPIHLQFWKQLHMDVQIFLAQNPKSVLTPFIIPNRRR